MHRLNLMLRNYQKKQNWGIFYKNNWPVLFKSVKVLKDKEWQNRLQDTWQLVSRILEWILQQKRVIAGETGEIQEKSMDN